MLGLILDSKTAITGALQGINICIYTVIPSLFPLMVLSIYITGLLRNSSLSILKLVSRICRLSEGTESLLLVGFIGGYPIGAQCIANEYGAGRLSKKDAQRMLGFCSNAGPSFIFGVAGMLFQSALIPWLLWIIHIVSSIMTGIFLPGSVKMSSKGMSSASISINDAVRLAIRSITYVCGWVILFRTLSMMLTTWFLWRLPIELQVIISGAMELVNGFNALHMMNNESLKFILCSVFLAFGGVCVCMQTMSVIGDLDIKCYLKGKLIQTVISLILAYIASMILFPGNNAGIPIIIFITAIIIMIFSKIVVDFQRKMIYNTKKSSRG